MIEKIMYAVISIKTGKPVFESFDECEVNSYLCSMQDRTSYIKAMRRRMVPCDRKRGELL